MNKLQSIELEILKEVLNVCDKLHLKHYLVCGSALGAVKYQGFIPWDDDIDVALPRDDYEIFCSKASAILPEYLFLQTYKTDKYFPCLYCKIRNSKTTYIETSASNIDMNHGIYIDVFPLDGYPKEKLKINLLELKKKIIKLQVFCAFRLNDDASKKAKFVWYIGRTLKFHNNTQKLLARLDELLSKWNIKDSDYICNHGNWQGKLEYAPRWHYGNGTWAEFEGLKVRIPEKYDAYLTQKYGSWRDDLPIEKQKSHHYFEICDTEKSYKKYV